MKCNLWSLFLAIQDNSIGDLVTNSLSEYDIFWFQFHLVDFDGSLDFHIFCCKHAIVFHAHDHKRMYGSHIRVANIPTLIRSQLVYWKPTSKCSLVQLVFKRLFFMIRSQKHYLQPIWLVRARTRANLWKVFPKNIRMNHYRDSLAWVSKKIVFFFKKGEMRWL